VETVTGSANSDAISATATTFSAGDVIDGGTGTDTLTITDTAAGMAGGVPAGVSVKGVERAVIATSGKLGTNVASAGSSTAEEIVITYAASTSGATSVFTINGVALTGTAAATDTTGEKSVDAAVAALTAIYQSLGYTVSASTAPDAASKLKITPAAISTTDYKVTITGFAGTDIPNPTVTSPSNATQLPAIVTTPSTVGAAAVSAVAYDVSGFTGLETLTTTSVGGANVKAAKTTDVALTNTGNGDVVVAGGKAVSVVETTGTGTKTITGSGLTSVSLTGGSGVATIDNTGGVAGTTTETGTTLTTVNITNVNAAVTAKGASIATLNIKGATAATNTHTVTNGTANHTLAVNLDSVGYDSAAAAQAQTIADATATTMTITSAGTKNNVILSGAVLTNVNASGATELALGTLPSAVDKVDASGLTGKFSATVASNLASGDYVKGSAGADTIALGSVTVTSTAAIDLGAGDDKITGTGAVASTASINGGDGSDTIGVALINNTSKAAITGFEKLDVTGLGNTTFDFALAKFANSIDTVVVAGNVHASGSTIDNLTVGAGINYTASATGLLILTETGRGLNAASTSVDELGVSFSATANTDLSAKTVTVASLTAQDINTLNVTSGGGSKVDNVLTAFVSDEIKTINVTGANKFTLTNVYSASTTKTTTLTKIDASASTGGLVLNTSVQNGNIAVLLGSGDDVITAGFVSTSSDATSSVDGADTITGFTKATTATVNAGKGYDIIGILDGHSTPVTIVDADAAGSTTAVKVKDGVVDFSVLTSGPASLAAAIALVGTAMGTAGDTSVFEYGGDTYSFTQNASHDLIVKFVGLTGVTKLVEIGTTDTFYMM
jgi:S-layer protein